MGKLSKEKKIGKYLSDALMGERFSELKGNRKEKIDSFVYI